MEPYQEFCQILNQAFGNKLPEYPRTWYEECQLNKSNFNERFPTIEMQRTVVQYLKNTFNQINFTTKLIKQQIRDKNGN